MWPGYCSAETLAPPPEPAFHRTASLTSWKRRPSCCVSGQLSPVRGFQAASEAD